jgi:hypothetical protein
MCISRFIVAPLKAWVQRRLWTSRIIDNSARGDRSGLFLNLAQALSRNVCAN